MSTEKHNPRSRHWYTSLTNLLVKMLAVLMVLVLVPSEITEEKEDVWCGHMSLMAIVCSWGAFFRRLRLILHGRIFGNIVKVQLHLNVIDLVFRIKSVFSPFFPFLFLPSFLPFFFQSLPNPPKYSFFYYSPSFSPFLDVYILLESVFLSLFLRFTFW